MHTYTVSLKYFNIQLTANAWKDKLTSTSCHCTYFVFFPAFRRFCFSLFLDASIPGGHGTVFASRVGTGTEEPAIIISLLPRMRSSRYVYIAQRVEETEIAKININVYMFASPG